MAYDIASPKSYEVLQARRERGELGGTSQRLYTVTGYRPFIADVDEDGDAAHPNPPTIALGARDTIIRIRRTA